MRAGSYEEVIVRLAKCGSRGSLPGPQDKPQPIAAKRRRRRKEPLFLWILLELPGQDIMIVEESPPFDTGRPHGYDARMTVVVQHAKRRWTEADLQALPEDGYIHELVDGELIMSSKDKY